MDFVPPVVARSPDRATGSDRRSPDGDTKQTETFRRAVWPGQETGPQQEAGPLEDN